MNVWALVPVQPWDEGKTRLAATLNAADRDALNRKFFQHVLDVAIAACGATRVVVVSRSEAILDAARHRGVRALAERAGGDLNSALTDAAKMATDQGAAAVLSVSCDLPFLTADDLRVMCDVLIDKGAVVAPDHAGLGTNALLLSAPVAISYAYGEGSFPRHMAALEAAGIDTAIVRRDGLAYDIDSPSDLVRLRSLKPDF